MYVTVTSSFDMICGEFFTISLKTLTRISSLITGTNVSATLTTCISLFIPLSKSTLSLLTTALCTKSVGPATKVK